MTDPSYWEPEGRRARNEVRNKARSRRWHSQHRSLDDESVEVDVFVVAAPSSKRAVLVRCEDTGDEEWVPRSLIRHDEQLERNQSTTIELAKWKADELGWC